uniref:Uncharacterized protein n=1 Tax=Rhizophora mucronata TaxID=61149 RepID=A0A2P2J2T9_RHIMU
MEKITIKKINQTFIKRQRD